MGRRIEKGNVRLKRAYESPSAGDGTRVLVDRLWPRGVRKEDAAIDHWAKDLSPSTTLRKWFGHDPTRWDEFRVRYRAELSKHDQALERVREFARKGRITLVYAAHDESHSCRYPRPALGIEFNQRGENDRSSGRCASAKSNSRRTAQAPLGECFFA